MGLRTLFINGRRLLSRRQNNIFSAALTLAIAFGLSAFLGVVRDRFLYARFYACCAPQLDAYNAAFRLPDLVFQLLVIGALSAAFIPVFSEKLLQNPREAYSLARATGTLLALIFLPLAAIIFLFARPLSALITANFTEEQIDTMANLTRIMIFAQFFFLFSNLTTGVLQVKKRFLLPALSPIVYNLGIILGIKVFANFLGIYGPAVGVLLGAVFHLLIQLPLALKLGFSFRPEFSFRRPEIKRILKLMLPRSLSLGLGQIENTVIMFLATTFPPGSLSLLYLAEHLSQLFSRLFGVTIGQAALPSFSSLTAARKNQEFAKVFLDSLLESLYLALLAATAVLVLRIPLVRLAFGARQFPWAATLKTGKVLAFLTPAIVANSGIQIATRGFYALQDTKKPFFISLFSLLIILLVGFGGVFWLHWQIYALVLAISLAAVVRFFLLLFLISQKIEGFNWKRIREFLGKSIVLVTVSGPVFWGMMHFLEKFWLDTTRVWGLLVLTLLTLGGGTAVYLFLSLRLGMEEGKVLLTLLRRFCNFRQLFLTSQEQIKDTKELLETQGELS
ncbi:murein biosynthesis integral membrane protein MurJ [bacterium]|nr:murein biosynthesis integral membrane protein MurJ [bacterium]